MGYGWEKFIRKKTEGKLCHRYCKKGARARPVLSLHNCAASLHCANNAGPPHIALIAKLQMCA